MMEGQKWYSHKFLLDDDTLQAVIFVCFGGYGHQLYRQMVPNTWRAR